jgi:hypothetical protein
MNTKLTFQLDVLKEQHIKFQDWALNDMYFLASWKDMFVHSLAKSYIIETFNNKPMFNDEHVYLRTAIQFSYNTSQFVNTLMPM